MNWLLAIVLGLLCTPAASENRKLDLMRSHQHHPRKLTGSGAPPQCEADMDNLWTMDNEVFSDIYNDFYSLLDCTTLPHSNLNCTVLRKICSFKDIQTSALDELATDCNLYGGRLMYNNWISKSECGESTNLDDRLDEDLMNVPDCVAESCSDDEAISFLNWHNIQYDISDTTTSTPATITPIKSTSTTSASMATCTKMVVSLVVPGSLTFALFFLF